jgi:hypothetical protein
MHPIELLDDVCHMESHFCPFGYCVSFDATHAGQKNPRPNTEPEQTEPEPEQTENSVLGRLFGSRLPETE